MIKNKILTISLLSSIFGVTLAGCVNETEVLLPGMTDQTEYTGKSTHKKESFKTAFDYYDAAPLTDIAETPELLQEDNEDLSYETDSIPDITEVIEEYAEDPTESEPVTEEQVIDPVVTEEIIEKHEQEEAMEQENTEPENLYNENYSGYNENYAHNGTKIWWTAISSEPQLVLSEGYVNGKERPSSVATRTGAAYVINGGEWWTGSGMACGVTGIGDTIYQALYDGENGDTLILRQDGQLDSVYMTEDVYRQINPKWAVKGFVPIINGGARTTYNHARQPRTFIGQDWNGIYYIGVSGGRGNNGCGLTYDELYEFAVGQMSSDLRFLYAMDGGGSSALVCDGMVVNSPTDGSERAVVNCIVFY